MIRKEKGFTLIELLVVVAIIGILSSVVLASLSSARNKGRDAAIKSGLASARAEAEILADEITGGYLPACVNNNFSGTTDSILNNIRANINQNGGVSASCSLGGSANDKIAFYSNLTTTGGWCIDSSGFNGPATSSSVGVCSSSGNSNPACSTLIQSTCGSGGNNNCVWTVGNPGSCGGTY